MIVPSHGHNVAPVLIEARIKKEVPFLSNVILVGDGQDYICCLLTLKVCVIRHSIIMVFLSPWPYEFMSDGTHFHILCYM